MPEMDGYSLASTLRQAGHNGPIIALTAHAMAEDKARCLGAGCNGYVTKPIAKKRSPSGVRRMAEKWSSGSANSAEFPIARPMSHGMMTVAAARGSLGIA
jgi:CheY-like chemotaxis protein